jgi:hypothetical protein
MKADATIVFDATKFCVREHEHNTYLGCVTLLGFCCDRSAIMLFTHETT